MAIDLFEIYLSNPPNHIYGPGEQVTGTVILKASPNTDLRAGITITLYGYAHVVWMEDGHRFTKCYGRDEEIFKKYLTIPAKFEQHVYPFIMQIPNIPMLPWTATTKHVKVEYGVEALIRWPWLGDEKAKLQPKFTLKSHINETLVGYSRNKSYYQSLTIENSDKVSGAGCCFPFCCWYFCSSKVVKVTLKLVKLWVYPGDKLQYTLELDNTTERMLGNVKIQLIGAGKQAGLCEDNDGNLQIDESLHAEELHETGGVNPGEVKMTEGYIKIPKNIKPTQVECSFLILTYKLKVIINEISGFRWCGGSATAEVDVVIGTQEDYEAPLINTQVVPFLNLF